MAFDDFDDSDSFSDFERWDYFYGDDEPTPRRVRRRPSSDGARLTDDEIKRIRRRADQMGSIAGIMLVIIVVVLIYGLFYSF